MKFPAGAFARRQLLLGSGLRATTSLLFDTTATTATTTTTLAATAPRLGLPTTQRRFEATTARTKRLLNIPPHFSFTAPPDQESDVIVFNPPSAAASVFHTPFKFLPPTDPRRVEGLAAFLSEHGSQAEVDPALLPEVPIDRGSWTTRGAPKYNVTFEQAMEIKRLRAEDPYKWTVHKLAAKFDCSPRFIVQCAPASKAYRAEQDKELEVIKRKWGQKKTKAREDKGKRREMLLNNRL